MKEKIMVSSCILGNNTKYNGGNNYNPLIEKIKEKYEIIVICPEAMGGLSTPRNPSEIKDNIVISNKGIDVTYEFNKGADIAYQLALKHNIKKAILKDGSPSCGSKFIYDGTFTGTKIEGKGVAVKRLLELGIIIYTEKEIEKLL